MIILGIWLAASLLFGACWALAGVLLLPPEADPTAAMLEAEGETAWALQTLEPRW